MFIIIVNIVSAYILSSSDASYHCGAVGNLQLYALTIFMEDIGIGVIKNSDSSILLWCTSKQQPEP